MKKEKINATVSIILLIIGFGLVTWGAIEFSRYPGMRELRRAAMHTVRLQYYFGLALLITAYLLTINWGKFKSKSK
jgi:hypothetical protein